MTANSAEFKTRFRLLSAVSPSHHQFAEDSAVQTLLSSNAAPQSRSAGFCYYGTTEATRKLTAGVHQLALEGGCTLRYLHIYMDEVELSHRESSSILLVSGSYQCISDVYVNHIFNFQTSSEMFPSREGCERETEN